MPSILITFLTSNEKNIKWLRQSITVAKNQQNNIESKTSYIITLCIVVNSLNPNYFNRVVKEFPNVWCLQTKSNGLPGKGHNSVLNIFKHYRNTLTREPFDYLIPLDGDDFLYPVAVLRIIQHIESSIQRNCQVNVLLLPFSDSLTQRCLPTTLSVELTSNIHLKYNNYICPDKRQQNWIEHTSSLPPFTPKTDANQYKTSARIILVSQTGLKLGFQYCEQSWLDDLLPFVRLYAQIEHFGSKKTGIYLMNDCDIFLYNRLTPDSATDQLCKMSAYKKTSQNNIVKNTVSKPYKRAHDWNVAKIKFLPVLESSAHFSVKNKIQFCRELLEQISDLMNGLIQIQATTYVRPSYAIATCNYFIEKAKKEKNIEMCELYTKEKLDNTSPTHHSRNSMEFFTP
jgi:hypothetical protein